MTQTTPVIACSAVDFQFASEPVLEGVTFTLPAGEYVGILGGNGSGKTTLLKVILGLLPPTSGEVRLFGTPVAQFLKWEWIGYVPQHVFRNDANFPATVREIVASGDTGKKMPRDGVREALERVGVGHLVERRIGELSGGERQRVFIARALVDNPRLLILDEPTTGIDQQSQEAFYALLSRLHQSGITIVLVSHDLDAVAREVQTVLCLNRKIVCSGPPEALANQEILTQTFGDKHHILYHHHSK